MQYLLPKACFDGTAFDSERVIVIEDGIVTGLMPLAEIPDGAQVERTDSFIAPGFFDVQVNGGGGVMLNNTPTREGVRSIAAAHNACGTAWLLPTVITDAPEVMEKAADAVHAELGKNGVLGIHIEGPHINPVHKGTHNPAFIRPFDDRTMKVLERLCSAGMPVLLTLAPEMVEPGLIAQLTRMGVIVSAGHTAADADTTRRALAEGLRCFTHLFNGMPQMTSRAPAITGAAINSDAWCGIIADGHHVADEMVGLAVRARPKPDRMILVSDAMSTIGGPNSFELYGEVITVENGRLVNANGSLAGAHIDLASSVSRMVQVVGVPAVDAVKMAFSNPFEMMGLSVPSMIGRDISQIGRCCS